MEQDEYSEIRLFYMDNNRKRMHYSKLLKIAFLLPKMPR